MTDLKLYESEYRFMDLIWEAEPVRSTELAKMDRERLEWKKSTCYTVLKKLEAKGFVKNEDATVTSLIGREQPADRKELRRFSSGLSQCVPQRTQADG